MSPCSARERRVSPGQTPPPALDYLILQFDGTDAGQRSIAAWKRASIIVDAGHGHSAEDPTPGPAPKPVQRKAAIDRQPPLS